MKTRSTEYIHEDENGNETTVVVEYTISPYIHETREQPAEGGEIEITSTKIDGTETEFSDDVLNAITKQIEEDDDFTNEEYFYEDEEE